MHMDAVPWWLDLFKSSRFAAAFNMYMQHLAVICNLWSRCLVPVCPLPLWSVMRDLTPLGFDSLQRTRRRQTLLGLKAISGLHDLWLLICCAEKHLISLPDIESQQVAI